MMKTGKRSVGKGADRGGVQAGAELCALFPWMSPNSSPRTGVKVSHVCHIFALQNKSLFF